jgi:UDP-N-acetylglucosamine 2-epimerase
MDKLKILVLVGCRSDEGLSAPIIKRLKADDFFDCYVYRFNHPGEFERPYEEMAYTLEENYFDLVFITGDRIEMTAGACACFHNNTKIAHYYGGILNDPITTLDDINRHCISLWSTIQFVESTVAMINLFNLLTGIKKKANIYKVGITHMEDIEVDESLVPKGEYDLVLVNPTTLTKEIPHFLMERGTIVIGPNPDIPLDPDWEPFYITYPNLPRPQFLGLLKNCHRFITNSSAGLYEAPHFLNEDQIVMVGDRNKNRTSGYFKGKKPASELIIEHLKEWWKDNE